MFVNNNNVLSINFLSAGCPLEVAATNLIHITNVFVGKFHSFGELNRKVNLW